MDNYTKLFWKTLAKIEGYILGFGFLTTSLLMIGIYTNDYFDRHYDQANQPPPCNFLVSKDRKDVWKELMPFVEKQDSQPGFSIRDYIDLVKRAQAPVKILRKEKPNVRDFTLNQLETALNNYQIEQFEDSLRRQK